ncbi:lipopolysaccharide biosynthesis protein [Modestobacter sp. SYSU DS0511]
MSSSPADATRQVLGRGSLYTLATAAPAAAAVGVLPVVTRVLDAPQFGVVSVGLAVVQVGLILFGLGLGAAVTRVVVLEGGGTARGAALVVRGAVLAVALGAVSVVTGPWWSPWLLDLPWSAALAWAVVAAAAGSVVVLVQSHLRGTDRVGSFVLLALTANLGGPAAGLVLVTVGTARASGYTAGVAAGQLVAAVVGLVALLRREQRRGGPGALADGLRLGLPTLPHQVSLYLAVGGLVVIANHLIGPVAGGRANIVLTLGVGGTVLIAAMNNAWAPAVYRAAPADRPAVLDASTRRIGLMAALVGGAVALSGPWLLRLLASADYAPSELVAPLAAVTAATVLSVPYLASGHLVFAVGRTGGLALTTPLSVAAGLAAGGLAMAAWGLIGLAVGYLTTYVGLAVGTTVLQRRVSPTPWWPPFMPLALTVTVAASTAGALLPADGAGAVVRLVGAVLAIGALGAVLLDAVRPGALPRRLTRPAAARATTGGAGGGAGGAGS